MKILIAEFNHESNTYSKEVTGIDSFKKCNLFYSEELLSGFSGVKTEVGGFIEFLSKKNDIEIIPSVAAHAWPCGKVKQDVFEIVAKKIKEQCSNHPDGILISLHGATVLENSEDGAGDLLEEIRSCVGYNIPIFSTLDFHANVTEKMLALGDAFFGYNCYPHTDMYECGYKAAECLYSQLKGKVKIVKSAQHIPLLCPLISTQQTVWKNIFKKVDLYKSDSAVISISILAGFPYADVSESGMTVIVETDNNLELADKMANELADYIFSQREDLKMSMLSVSEAVLLAKNSKSTVVLADVSDNPGCGCPGDTTELLSELIRQKVKKCYFALIHDPQTVSLAKLAGVGKSLNVSLGGKNLPECGKSVRAEAKVINITDGIFENKGIMAHGTVNHMGDTVVLKIDDIYVIVVSEQFQPWDPEIFVANGLDPHNANILVVKSTVHYRASFSSITKSMIDVDASGMCPMNLNRLKPKNCNHPIYPLDDIKERK